MKRTRHIPMGLTLAEMIVSVVVGALLAGATTTAVSQMLRAADRAEARAEACTRAQNAVDRIALDAAAALRDADLLACHVIVADARSGDTELDELLVYSRLNRPVRSAEAEGGEFEVQYRVALAADGSAALWRRADPVPDLYFDAGGVAAPVVAGAVSLSIEATDGERWYGVWDSDSDGLPHAVRFTVATRSDDGKVTVWARRMVALDRTPLPLPAEEAETEIQFAGGVP